MPRHLAFHEKSEWTGDAGGPVGSRMHPATIAPGSRVAIWVPSSPMTTAPDAAADLVSALLRADHELRITNPKPSERAAWRRAIHATINSDAPPPGLRLRHTGRDRGDLVIRLVPDTPANEPRAASLEPVAIPEHLARPHALVAATRDAAGKRTTG